MKIPALLALLILPILARAGALEDYCQAQFAAGQHNANAVHAALLERVVLVATNPVARSAGLVEDEQALEALVISGPNPLIATNDWTATAYDARAALVARRLDNRVLAARGNNDKSVVVLLLGAQVSALEARIVRRGYTPYGPLATQATEPIVTQTRGQSLWRVLGLPRAPTPAEVRQALRPPPAP